MIVPLLLIGLVASPALAQDWSGASLRAAARLALPPGYRLEVIATGVTLPQDLALEPPDGLWVLAQADRVGGAAGGLIRVPLDDTLPLDAARLPAISIPFSPDPARFRVGSLARHPASGDLYVGERLGRHVFRLSAGQAPALYARGLNLLSDSRTLAFDADGRLVVLDYTGRSAVAVAGRDPLREWFGEEPRYEGPVIYRVRLDEPVPVPRNLEYSTPAFPPVALRRGGARLGRYAAVLALGTGELVLSGVNGEIDRFRRDGTIAPIGRVPAGRVVGAGPGGELYALDHLGGRIVKVQPDGAVHPFVEGLARPAAVAVGKDGVLFIAEDTGRVLRLSPAGAAP